MAKFKAISAIDDKDGGVIGFGKEFDESEVEKGALEIYVELGAVEEILPPKKGKAAPVAAKAETPKKEGQEDK